MTISSPAFADNSPIPARYTCDDQDISPALTFAEAPQNTQSLALMIDDPDSPSGSFIHWLIWNINPQTAQIDENSRPPEATEGQSSFGKTGYGGPCPHAGTHRYIFKLYALDAKLNLSSSADKKQFEQAVQNHILAQSELIGLYQRPTK